MKQIISILLIIGLFSCGTQKSEIELIDDENLTTIQIDSILEIFDFDYESPIILDSTNQVLIPISTELINTQNRYSKDGYSKDIPRYWNILFYNRRTGENRLLTEDKIRISDIYTNNQNDEEYYGNGSNEMSDKILYQIGDVDFNKDGQLNSDDPEALFSSEIDGTNLQQISPMNEDLIYFEGIPNSKQILIRTRRDINQDLVFNRKDKSIWYKAELINEVWDIKEIIDSTDRKKIKNLYFEQWLKK